VRTLPVAGEDGVAPTYETSTSSTTTTTARSRPRDGASTRRRASTTTTTTEPPLPADGVTTGDLYGPSDDDRLTLVTAGSRVPWATDRATVVVATMRGRPFEPTPQGGRTTADDGRSSDAGVWAPLALAGLAYLAAAVVAVVLYRRARPRAAYLITAPPLLAATVLTAEAVARTLPAWF
jgi:hypothetical protein